MKTTVQIPGMHCNSCAALITDVSKEFTAVHEVQVDLKSKEVMLQHDENFDLKAWIKEIESLGDAYKVIHQ